MGSGALRFTSFGINRKTRRLLRSLIGVVSLSAQNDRICHRGMTPHGIQVVRPVISLPQTHSLNYWKLWFSTSNWTKLW